MKTEINSSNIDPNSFKGWNNEIKDKENNVILRKSNQKRFIQYNPKTGKITVKTLNFFEKFLRTVGLFGYDKYRSSKYIHSLKEGKILTNEQNIKKAEIRQKTDDAWKAYFNRGDQEQTSSTRSSSENEDEQTTENKGSEKQKDTLTDSQKEQTTEKKKSERQKSEQKSSEEKLPKELQSYEVNLDDKESSSLEKLLQQLLDHGDHQNLKCLELVAAIGKKMGPKITPNKESLYLNINYDNLLLQALKERKWSFAKFLIHGYSNHSNEFSIPNLFESIFKDWYGNTELMRDPEFGLSKDFFFSIVDQYFTEEHFKVDQEEGKIAPHFLLFLYRYGRPEWKSDKVLKLISMLAEKSNIGYSSGRYMYADYYYVQKYIGVKQPYVKAFCEGYFKREDSFRNIRLITLDLVRKRPDEAFYQWFWDLSSTLKTVDSGFTEFFLFYSAVQASEDNQTSMDIWKTLMQNAEESDLKSTYQFNDQEKYTLLEYSIRYGKNVFAKDIVDTLIKKGDTSNHIIESIARQWPTSEWLYTYYIDQQKLIPNDLLFKLLQTDMPKNKSYESFISFLLKQSDLSKIHDEIAEHPVTLDSYLNKTISLPKSLKFALSLLTQTNIYSFTTSIQYNIRSYFTSPEANAALGAYALSDPSQLTNAQPLSIIKKNCELVLTPKSTYWDFNKMVRLLSSVLTDKTAQQFSPFISSQKDQWDLINHLYGLAKNDLSASQHLEFIKYCVDLKGATNEKLESNFSDSIKQVSEKDFNKLMFTIATNWPKYQMVLEKYLDATNTTYDDVTLKVFKSALVQKDEHKTFVFHLIDKSTLSKVKSVQPDSSFSVEGTLSGTSNFPEVLRLALNLLISLDISRLSYSISNYLKDQFPSQDINAILGSYILNLTLRLAPQLKEFNSLDTIKKNCTTILSPKSTDWTFKRMVNTLSEKLSDKSSIESASLISNPKDKLALINYLYSHAKDGLNEPQHLEFISYYVDLKGDTKEKLESNFSDSVKKMSEKNANKLLLTIATNWPKYQMVLEKYLEVTGKSYNEVSINALKQKFSNEKEYTGFVLHLVEKSDLLNIEKHPKVTQFDLSAALEEELKESDDIPLIITLINEVELNSINYDIRSKIKESITSDNAKKYITVHMLKKNMKNVDNTSISRIESNYRNLLDKEHYDSDFLTIVNDLANKSLGKELSPLIYKLTKQISSEKDKFVLINWLYKMGLDLMTTKEHLSLVNYVLKKPNYHNNQILQSIYKHAISKLPVEENLIFKREKTSFYDRVTPNLFEQVLILGNENLLNPVLEAIKSAKLDKDKQLLNVLSSYIAYGNEKTYIDDYLNLFSLRSEELLDEICKLEEFKPSQLVFAHIEKFYEKLINKAVSKDAVTLPESFNVRKDANSEKVSKTLETLFNKKNKDERFNTALRNFFNTIEGKRILYLLTYERNISTGWKSILGSPKPDTSDKLTKWIEEEDTFSYFREKDCEKIHESIKNYLQGEVSQQAIEHSLWKVIGKMHSPHLLKGNALVFAYKKSTSLVELFIDKMKKIPLRHDFSTHKLNNPIELFDYFDVFTCILNNAKTQDKDYKKFLTEIAIKLLESKKLTNESALSDEELYKKLFEKLQEFEIEVPKEIKQSYLKD